MIYKLSCTDIIKNCKLCHNNGSCISCYNGTYLEGDSCKGLCGNSSNYLRYADNNSWTCTPCINNCQTCDN